MAKVSLSKLIPKGNDNSKTETAIINGEQVAVIGYLPIDAKSKLIETVLSYTFDDNGIMSPVRQEAAFYVGLIKYYTNINIIMNCYKFYINKYAFVKDEIPDLSFIPMLMRRKLDNLSLHFNLSVQCK